MRLSIFSFTVWVLAAASLARADVPPAPEFGVLDEAQAFSLPVLKAAERVLSEHRRLTNETVFVAVLKSVPEGRLEDRATEILGSWRMETPNPPNTVLLLADAERGELFVRTGLGLDPVLTETEAQEIVEVYFKPEWRVGKTSRALTFAVVETLRALESPLIVNGEAVEAFERAGHAGGWTPISVIQQGRSWWIWVLAGAWVIGFTLYFALSVEAHYTALGWTRIPPWRALGDRLSRPGRGKSPALITGGGVSGSY